MRILLRILLNGAGLWAAAQLLPGLHWEGGWLYLLVTTPATIGALSTFFAELLLGLAGVDAGRAGPWAVPAIAAATILVVSFVNVLGARPGTLV